MSLPCKQELHCSGDNEEEDNKARPSLAQKDSLLKYLDLWMVHSKGIEQEDMFTLGTEFSHMAGSTTTSLQRLLNLTTATITLLVSLFPVSSSLLLFSPSFSSFFSSFLFRIPFHSLFPLLFSLPFLLSSFPQFLPPSFSHLSLWAKSPWWCQLHPHLIPHHHPRGGVCTEVHPAMQKRSPRCTGSPGHLPKDLPHQGRSSSACSIKWQALAQEVW